MVLYFLRSQADLCGEATFGDVYGFLRYERRTSVRCASTTFATAPEPLPRRPAGQRGS
jgi:hypothetical protein